MGILKRLRKIDIDSVELENIVNRKDAVKKSLLFVIGCLISSLSYNLFFVPNNFVNGGLGGLGIVLNHYLEIDPRMVLLIGNLILIIISIIILGVKESLLSTVGAITSIAFVYATKDIPDMINFSFDNILLYVLAAGVVGGFGEALVYKAGFNTGGNSIVALIVQHYKNKPLGIIIRNVSLVVILLTKII